jgi:cytochrome c553
MKKLTSIIVALLFILGVASIGLTAEKAEKPADKAVKAEKAENKCAKCHKGDKALDKVVEKKKIKTVAEFMKAVKEGPKAKVHANAKLTDDDIKAAAKDLKLAEK